MKKTVTNSISLMFVVMMVLFASCKTQEPQACKVEPSEITNVKINSLSYSFSIFDYQTGKEGKSDADFSLALTSNKIPSAEFDKIQILNDVFNASVNSNSIMTAIFITANESSADQIQENKVGAVALWYKESGKLKMAVYKRNTANDKLTIDGDAYETKGIRMEDFYKIDRKVKHANTMLAGHNTVYVLTSEKYDKIEYDQLRKNTKAII